MEMDDKKKIIISLFGLVVVAVGFIYLSRSYPSQTTEPEEKDTEKKVEFQIETLQSVDGYEAVKPGDLIVVNYIGFFQDGKIFDSNLSSGKPFETFIGKGEAFQGWDQGLIGMKIGEKRKLIVPPDFDSGSETKGDIPKDSVLYFEVELLEIK